VPFLEGLAAIEDRMVMVLNLTALSDRSHLAEAA
jgi:purine-binding chemotaxis protein CheW